LVYLNRTVRPKKNTTSKWVYLLSRTVISKVIHGSFLADTFQILNKFRYKPFLVGLFFP